MKVIKSIFAVFLTFVFVVAFDRLTQELFTNLSLNSVPSPTTKNPQSVEFPKDFSFGSASSAFQTEGAWNEDGKSASMWDVYTHQHPELVFDGSSADVGPNSYHFYGDDIEAVKSVGVSF